ncbi:MAG: diguanylate cyclase [Cytophagales bacterium]|nr:diguanylate cyclase [Rhizobacter sp.]
MTRSAPTRSLHWQASLQGGVLAAGAALLLLLGGAVQLALSSEYRNAVDAILSDSDRTAHKLAARTGEVLDRVNQSTLLVKYLHERGQLPPLQSLRNGGVLSDDVTRVVTLTDPKGFVIDGTSTLVALNIADDDRFKAHKKQADLDLTIGVGAPDPLAGGWSIPVSRRVNLPNGAFGGLVTAAIDPAALSAGYAKSEAPDTAIGVLGLDGVYRSRLLGGKVSFGEKIDVARLERRSREIHATRRPVASQVDRVERFVASVRVERYPLVAVVAVNADTALAGYRNARAALLGWAAAVALLISAGVWLLRAKVIELERSRRQTRRAETAFRATLEGSMDAVSIMQAERDDQGQLIDMLVTECNARAAALIGLTSKDAIGQRLCVLAPTMRSGGFLAKFEHAIQTGKTSSAEVQATDTRLMGRWLHHQVVPLEDGIALITRDVTERKQADRALADLAHLDALTQLGNRRDFEQRLSEAQARSARNADTLALVFVDLDGFKAINDTFGHAVGDQLLIVVANRLRDCVRVTDTVNRLGGDEFTVTLEGAGTEQHVNELCERILQSLSQPHTIAGHEVIATPSIGVAMLQAGESLASLQHRADTAMYRAKHAGKGRCFFSDTPPPVDAALAATA